MIGQLWGVARLELLRLLRSRVALSLLLVVPAFQVVLFGYAIAPSNGSVSIAIAAPRLDEANALAEKLAEEPGLRIVSQSAALNSAAAEVEGGRAMVGIDLPAASDAGDSLSPALPVHVTIDGSDAASASAAAQRIATIYWRELAITGSSAAAPADLEFHYFANPELKDSWTFLPSLTGVTVMISMLMLGCLSIAREKEGGSWETFCTLPIHPAVSIAGRLFPGAIIGVLQGSTVIAIARLLFGVPLPASAWVLALLILPVFAAAHLALGTALSIRAPNQLSALQGAVAFYLPAMLLSGFLYPREAMPGWARTLSEVFPLTHYVAAARATLLQARPPSEVAWYVLPIAAFLVLAVLMALIGQKAKNKGFV